MVEVSNENEEESSEQRRREGEREENDTETVKRRCEGFVAVEAFDICSQGRDLESCDDFSWEYLLNKTENLSAPSAKQAGGAYGRGRDEAAAKNGDYERSNKENHIKRKNGREEPVVGLGVLGGRL